MFNKFARNFDIGVLKKQFHLNDIRKNLEPKYIVNPGEQVPVIMHEGGRILTNMAWGIVPTWMKTNIKPLINARVETLGQLPTFKHLIRKNRCIIPASGYYESIGNEPRRYVEHRDYPILGFAGLWDENEKLVSGQKRRVTIITQEAEKGIASFSGRMPLILTPEAALHWLEPLLTPMELRTVVAQGKVHGLQVRELHGTGAVQSNFFPEHQKSQAA